MTKQSMIAIDPGEEHCGVAVFVDGKRVFSSEMKPTDLFDWWNVGGALYGNSKLRWDMVVCESFKLYPDKAASLTWSTLGTVEVIGVLRENCRREGIEFVLQPASIKRATAAKAKRLEMTLPRGAVGGGHAKDAWLHGLYYLWNQKIGE